MSNELRHYGDQTEIDPNQLFELEQRIAKCVDLARKRRVAPESLFKLHQKTTERIRKAKSVVR